MAGGGGGPAVVDGAPSVGMAAWRQGEMLRVYCVTFLEKGSIWVCLGIRGDVTRLALEDLKKSKHLGLLVDTEGCYKAVALEHLKKRKTFQATALQDFRNSKYFGLGSIDFKQHSFEIKPVSHFLDFS